MESDEQMRDLLAQREAILVPGLIESTTTLVATRPLHPVASEARMKAEGVDPAAVQEQQ